MNQQPPISPPPPPPRVERSTWERGITPGDCLQLAPMMKALVAHPAWPLYIEALRTARIMAREQATEAEDMGTVKSFKGYVEGLKSAEEYPGWIIAAAEEYAAAMARGRILPYTTRKQRLEGDDGSPTFG